MERESMKYTTYIFDFDFTLADASTGIIKCANYALSKLGFQERSQDEIRKTVGMTLQDMFSTLTGVQDKHLADLFFSHFINMADDVITDSTLLFDDTIDVLQRIKKDGCKTAIVSTKVRYRIEEALEKYDISGLVDYTVGLEDVDTTKPSPEGLQKAIEYLGTTSSSVLYIGDSLIDANTANNAGVDFGAVLTGTTTMSEFQQLPHVYIAKNLTELMEYVETIA